MEAKPYTKTLQDELDWKLLDQLSGVVSQISSFCFETKKFCVTTLFVVLTLMTKFTSDKLDDSIFVAGLCIPLCFWFLDSIGYFYQVKIRGTMEQIRLRLASQNLKPLVGADGAGIIEKGRVDIPIYQKVRDSAFNHSMWLYVVLIAADLVIWWLFCTGRIK
ncbi:hypothetical protein MF133_01890 [Aeromonas caviae]|uniref:hypothetical protein n=1 Tax=Aeromonas caviae TaxID=648 RepID=UPI001EF0992B|nr:hypothetical protein [Aeromonas caviae]ULH03209.1 hypothetical protein MF133_01890 [Aeromonas caviae]WDV26434.1 hypothetical protein PVK35_11365 [Aeromonas caviae]